MDTRQATELIKTWPQESRQAAQLVIEQYGAPQEATDSLLIWRHAGPWKRVVASKTFYRHEFPVPHTDSVESIIDYRVPAEKVSALAAFDGSVVVERTAGEISARCHDEQANFLALNLANDIVTGARSVQDARAHYAKEFLDFRRKKDTPYMKGLRFTPADREAADPDTRLLSDQDLERAAEQGKAAQPS